MFSMQIKRNSESFFFHVQFRFLLLLTSSHLYSVLTSPLSLLLLSNSICVSCVQQRRWIRQALVPTASRWPSELRRQIPTRSRPSPSWTSRPPQNRVTLHLRASCWSGTSQTATGRRSRPTSSLWTNKASRWNRGRVIWWRTSSQTVNTGTVIDLHNDRHFLALLLPENKALLPLTS